MLCNVCPCQQQDRSHFGYIRLILKINHEKYNKNNKRVRKEKPAHKAQEHFGPQAPEKFDGNLCLEISLSEKNTSLC